MPVGYVTFSSESRNLSEIQDLALFRVRPMFGTLPGVSGRPPFGGNQRTIVINVDPNRLRAYALSADEVIQAVAKNNVIVPSGYVRVGDQAKAAPINAVVRNIDELLEIPSGLVPEPLCSCATSGQSRTRWTSSPAMPLSTDGAASTCRSSSERTRRRSMW